MRIPKQEGVHRKSTKLEMKYAKNPTLKRNNGELMNSHNSPTIKQIIANTKLLKQARPSYEKIIDFYQDMFIFQEENKIDLNIMPVIIEDHILTMKRENDLPLVDTSEFKIDEHRALDLLSRLCELAILKAPGLAGTSEKILKAIKLEDLKPGELFSAMLQNKPHQLIDIAKKFDMPENELVFFIFASIKPAIQICAEQLAHYLENEPPRDKRYCPICGSLPNVAFFSSNGEKHLICGFCFHKWKTLRMGCTYCGNKDQDKQHYFFNEGEKEYRVDVCDQCGKYMKLIDLRKLDREFYPPLEQITSLHLDMQAVEHGYKSPVETDNI